MRSENSKSSRCRVCKYEALFDTNVEAWPGPYLPSLSLFTFYNNQKNAFQNVARLNLYGHVWSNSLNNSKSGPESS